jgi:hypothetical protein
MVFASLSKLWPAAVALLHATVLAWAATAQDVGSTRPDFVHGVITIEPYAGDDDLLTGGLGAEGLRTRQLQPLAPECPKVALATTKEELRKAAICNNYRALIDTTENGGYGPIPLT